MHHRKPVRVVRADRLGVGLRHVDGVVAAVDVHVEPGHQEVLVERRIRAFVDQRAVRMWLPRRERRGHHDAGGADLAFDVAVLVQPPVDQVLVVGDGDVERDRQPPHPAHLGADVVVDVLPQHGVVFLVDADGVGDRVRLALAVVQNGVQVADLAEAVAARAPATWS